MSDAVMVPRAFEEWLYGLEGYALRVERLSEEMRDPVDKLLPWLLAAFDVGRLAASPSVGGWEDISTAPKDGGAFLIAYDNGSVRAGYYLDNSHTPFPWKGVRPAHGTEPVTAKITHWMPLPEAPKGGEA